MDLTTELKKRFESFKLKAPAEIQQIMQKAHDELVNKKIAGDSLGVGDQFPDFDLMNEVGKKQTLSQILADQ